MSPTEQIAANGMVYTVTEDFTSVYRVVITGTATDETSGALKQRGFTVKSVRSDLNVASTPNGDWAVIAYPDRAFPNLSLIGYNVDLVFSAPGFMDRSVTVAIPAAATFPVPGPAIAMRREPVCIQGRIVADTPQRLPIGAATVIVVDDPSVPAQHPLALRAPLHAAHPAGATVREIGLSIAGSATLSADANSGGSKANLASRAGLAPGSILRFFNASDTAVEYGIVDTLGPGAPAAGIVTLRQPLHRSFAAGASVRFMNTGAAGASGTLLRDVDPGTGLILASAALASGPIEIDPGTANVEYHELGAIAGPDGYYSIDGIGSVKEVFLKAAHAGFTDVTQPWAVEYDRPVNVVDFRLP